MRYQEELLRKLRISLKCEICKYKSLYVTSNKGIHPARLNDLMDLEAILENEKFKNLEELRVAFEHRVTKITVSFWQWLIGYTSRLKVYLLSQLSIQAIQEHYEKVLKQLNDEINMIKADDANYKSTPICEEHIKQISALQKENESLKIDMEKIVNGFSNLNTVAIVPTLS